MGGGEYGKLQQPLRCIMLPNKILAFNNCQTYNLPRITKKSFILWYATVGSHITSPPASPPSHQVLGWGNSGISWGFGKAGPFPAYLSSQLSQLSEISWWKCLEVLHAVGIPKTSEFFSPAGSPWVFFWWRFGLFGDLELWKSRIIFFQFFCCFGEALKPSGWNQK